MVDNNYKFQRSPQLRQRPVSEYKHSSSREIKRVSLKQRMIPVGTLLMLGAWMGLCIMNNGYMLDKAMICSVIIVSFLFFRSAEQQGEWSDKD
jgi:hypothetical protein